MVFMWLTHHVHILEMNGESYRLKCSWEYEQVRNKSPERIEYQRLYAQKRLQRGRELGKCRNCSKPAILGQTRCFSCAEAHR